MLFRYGKMLMGSLAVSGAVAGLGAVPAAAGVLTTENLFLPSAANSPASAPYLDMVVNTSPVTTWGEKGAVGLQGNQSVFPVGGNINNLVNNPASIVTFKFNVGATIDTLNSTYGAGNWSIASPTLTMQYTYYSNNNIFGGGAGNFETYWVSNDSWAFGNGGASGNAYSDFNYVSGTDPIYATNTTTLATWPTSLADLGSTTYNWLSPASNPNYTSWATNKTGPNQGLLTDNLTADPALVSDITSATAGANPNLSFYLIPTSNTLGLTIFTGGGNETPELSFQVISVPEPVAMATAALCGLPLLLRRRRRS
jgi:hypothetical protein